MRLNSQNSSIYIRSTTSLMPVSSDSCTCVDYNYSTVLLLFCSLTTMSPILAPFRKSMNTPMPATVGASSSASGSQHSEDSSSTSSRWFASRRRYHGSTTSGTTSSTSTLNAPPSHHCTKASGPAPKQWQFLTRSL